MGISADAYVQWQYGVKAGEARAYHDGASWVVVEGEGHDYRLYGEDLFLDGDFTIAMLTRQAEPQTHVGLFSITETPGNDAVNIVERNGCIQAQVTTKYRQSANLMTRNSINLEDFGVLVLTFSHDDPTRHISLYQNGVKSQIEASARYIRPDKNGSGRPIRGASYLISGIMSTGGNIWGTYHGDIGPILVADRWMDEKEVGNLSNMMLGKGVI